MFICVGAFLAIGYPAQGAKIVWETPLSAILHTSASQPWGPGAHVELGVFKNGFTPTAGNTAQWATNWVPAQRKLFNTTNSQFRGSYEFFSNPSPFVANAKAYLWGFSGSESNGEWFLASGPTWKWPNAGNNPPNLTIGTAGSTAILGTIAGEYATPHIQTAAVTNALPPTTSWPQWAGDNLPGVLNPQPSEDNNLNTITDAWEYALHDGASPNPGQWLQVAEGDGERYLEMHIPRRRDRNANYTVEVTTDLVNGPWVSGPSYTDVVSNNAVELVVRDKTPVGQGGDRRFMRVKVAVP